MPVYNPNTTVQTDAAGAWLVGELERLYPKLYEPLASVTFHQHGSSPLARGTGNSQSCCQNAPL